MNRFVFGALFLGVVVSGKAVVVASYTAGGGPFSGDAYGQSVTTPVGGPWDSIEFNFLGTTPSNETISDFALGGLYVLSQAYTGAPDALSSSTAGYLGFTSTINDGTWDFSGVTLQPSTQYFFYMNSLVPLGNAVELDTSSSYTGGSVYYSGSVSSSYANVSSASAEFDLTGTQVSGAPEPGTALLMAGAAALVAIFRRRRI